MTSDRNVLQTVERHYGRGDILGTILTALRGRGHDRTPVAPADIAPVDEFHMRGREATIELARRARLEPGLRVLDVGCGLGGSARFLSAEHRCKVVGIDLTHEYVEAARALAELVGLDGAVKFQQANALDLPFHDASFDVAWTEHIQMNIADKNAFYAEIARVLAPGGRLVFHDIFQGPGGAPHFPVPWAETPDFSFLATPDAIRGTLRAVGFEITDWEDTTPVSYEYFSAAAEKLKTAGPPPIGIHLLMGPTAGAKFENVVRNLAEGRTVVFQAVARKN